MFDVTVESLYKCFDTISNESSSDSDKLKAFQQILQGCKGGPIEKKLSSQFIGRFFKSFPSENEKSFNCLIDLCEDEDPKTRIQAVRDLQQICKYQPDFIPRVSDILAQLIVTNDTSESNVINVALKSLLSTDPSSTVIGLFNQILSSKSDDQRQNLIKFLMEHLKVIPEEKMTTELEEFVMEQSKKLINDCSTQEFVSVIAVMSSLKSSSTLLGRQKLVNIITNIILTKLPTFDPHNAQNIDLLQNAGKQVERLMSKNVSAAQLLKHMLVTVVPSILLVDKPFQQRRILQILTNLSSHPGDAFTSISEENQVELLKPLYITLLSSLPEPTVISDGDTPAKASLPAFTIECLLYALLNLLSKFCPAFFCASVQGEEGLDKTSQEAVTRLQNLRQKAQYAARIIQSYKPAIVTELQTAFLAEGGCSVKTADEVRRALVNIEKMIRCIFRSKIDQDCLQDVSPSWIEPAPQKAATVNQVIPVGKRPAGQQQQSFGNKRGRFQARYRGNRR